MSAPDDVLGVIELASAMLVRNFELVRRRGDSPPELESAEYLLLRTLDAIGPVDICGLATALGLDPSTAGRQVAAMAEKGLVERAPSATDRRRSIISTSATGAARMETARIRRTRATAELLDGWSRQDLRTLAEMFTRYNRTVADHYLTDAGQDTASPRAVAALLPMPAPQSRRARR